MTGSPFLALPGAIAVGAGAGHYGNPLVEQRRLAAGEAVVDLADRAVMSVRGPDRLSWLNSISSQRLLGLAAGESAETLLLDQTGRIQHAIRLIDDGETAWLLVETTEAESLLGWLEKMRFMLRVEPADRSTEFAVIGAMEGPTASALPVAVENGTPIVWHDPWRGVVTGGHQYAQVDQHPGIEWLWSESVVARADLAGIAARAASGRASVAGSLALEALRIAVWRPAFGSEVDERSIPHELDWLRTAVHLTKGCYRGQETVAKVHNLGHPPRRLVMLHLDGSDSVLPAPGDEVWLAQTGLEHESERRVVGVITSSALHFELGPIALAMIKRTTDADTALNVDSGGVVVAASQEIIVPPAAGAVSNVPRLPRLRA